jgi:hypothetical protein
LRATTANAISTVVRPAVRRGMLALLLWVACGLPTTAAADRLDEIKASGEAAAIYDAWFGPKSDTPLPRSFRIQRE